MLNHPRPLPATPNDPTNTATTSAGCDTHSASRISVTATSAYASNANPADHHETLRRAAGNTATPIATAVNTTPSPFGAYGNATAATTPT
ncbi:hypothetical protein, partial [Acrocarpospora corrugata]|uniref:hypothetical protein n=1 Tax=Acrocarpospora corrugata TaxID=35763 RepID=UPI001C3F6208